MGEINRLHMTVEKLKQELKEKDAVIQKAQMRRHIGHDQRKIQEADEELDRVVEEAAAEKAVSTPGLAVPFYRN